MKKCVRLDRQLIEREMRRGEFQRSRDVRVRVLGALSGQRIHEIKIDVAEDVERRRRRGARLALVVHASERREVRGIEALHAQRQAVDAGGPEPGEPCLLERSGIRLERDLRVGYERNACAHRGENAVDRLGREQARRAAAEEDRQDPPSPDRRQCEFEIGDERVDVLRFGNRASPLVRVEVAVRTFLDAPRYVNVQRERRERRETRRGRRRHRDAAARHVSSPSRAARAALGSPCRGASARSSARAATRRR